MPQNPALAGLLSFGKPGFRRPPGRQSLYSTTTDTVLDDQDSVEPDPAIELMELQQQRKQELENQLSMSQRGEASPNELGGLKGLLGSLSQDINTSPLTKQAGEVESIRQADLDAIMHGFGGDTDIRGGPTSYANLGGFLSPAQRQAQHGAKMEQYKAEAPERQARIAGEFDVQQQETAGTAQRDVARINADARTRDAEAKAEAFGRLLQGGLQPGMSASMSGVGSVRVPEETQAPTQISRDLANALKQVADKKWTPEQALPYQVSELERSGMDPLDKQYLHMLLTHPEAQGKSYDEIQRNPSLNNPQLQDDEHLALSNMLRRLRNY